MLCTNDVVTNGNKLGAIKVFVDFPLASVVVVVKVTFPCPVAGETAHFTDALGTGFPELSRTITVSGLLAGVGYWTGTIWPSPETMETVWQKAAVASKLMPMKMRASNFVKDDDVTETLLRC